MIEKKNKIKKKLVLILKKIRLYINSFYWKLYPSIKIRYTRWIEAS